MSVDRFTNISVREQLEAKNIVASSISCQNISSSQLRSINLSTTNSFSLNLSTTNISVSNNINANGVISCDAFLDLTSFQGIPENTYDTSTISGLSSIFNKWTGGVLAPNGKIYGIPRQSSNVLIIDPQTNTYDTSTITGLTGSTSKYIGGVMGTNGKIYGIPANATNVLQIRTGLPTIQDWNLQAYFNKF